MCLLRGAGRAGETHQRDLLLLIFMLPWAELFPVLHSHLVLLQQQLHRQNTAGVSGSCQLWEAWGPSARSLRQQPVHTERRPPGTVPEREGLVLV